MTAGRDRDLCLADEIRCGDRGLSSVWLTPEGVVRIEPHDPAGTVVSLPVATLHEILGRALRLLHEPR